MRSSPDDPAHTRSDTPNLVSGTLMLPRLMCEALDLTDTLCLAALERGDVGGFHRHAKTAASLREFAASASLLP